MPYRGLPLVCERCGQTFTRPPSLKRHLAERRCPGRAALSAQPKPRSLRAEILDVTPSRSEIVPAMPLPERPARSEGRSLVRISANKIPAATLASFGGSRPAGMADGDGPPSWWEPQADPRWRLDVWTKFPPDYRNRLVAQRAGAAFSIRPPEATDKVILSSQYHALKALATRLDAGLGTERERVAFEAGLREYDANYNRIRAQRKS